MVNKIFLSILFFSVTAYADVSDCHKEVRIEARIGQAIFSEPTAAKIFADEHDSKVIALKDRTTGEVSYYVRYNQSVIEGGLFDGC